MMRAKNLGALVNNGLAGPSAAAQVRCAADVRLRQCAPLFREMLRRPGPLPELACAHVSAQQLVALQAAAGCR